MVDGYFVHAIRDLDSDQIAVCVAAIVQVVCAAERSECSVPEC